VAERAKRGSVNLPLAKGRYGKPAQKLSSLLAVSAIAVWLFHLYIWYQYDGTRPRQPDAMSGRFYAQNTHGHVVYLTREEDAGLTKLTILTFSLFGTAFLIGGLFVKKVVPTPWEKRRW
jgi:hypothetical protein